MPSKCIHRKTGTFVGYSSVTCTWYVKTVAFVLSLVPFVRKSAGNTIFYLTLIFCLGSRTNTS